MDVEQGEIFSRHILLEQFGKAAQEAVLKAKVCVVGCGGLGSGLLPYLVSSGVGQIQLVDSGEVEASNLQRQILYAPEEVGQSKVTAALARLEQINHSSELSGTNIYITSDNIAEVIGTGVDLVIDCTDNFQVRYLLADYCWNAAIPLLSAAILGFDGHIMSLLRAEDNPCLRCLVSAPPENYRRASEVGVFGPAVGVMGTLQANQALKILTGCGEILARRFLSFDFFSMRITIMERSVDPECSFCSKDRQ